MPVHLNANIKKLFCFTIVFTLFFSIISAQTVSGTLRKWHDVTLTFNGVSACENSDPNPFTQYRLIVTFTKGSKSYDVPGYFAADGNAANTSATCGNKWRVHFIPDEAGTWNYTVSFRSGTNLAISDNLSSGTAVSPVNGMSGSFSILETNKTGKDFRGKGKLRYAGQHHLKFDNGTYFLKGGTDSPENFLAYWEFDGTYDDGNGANGLQNGLHRFSDHVQDWNSNDPTWQNGKGKGIIGALNYLAAQGVNSAYFLTMNIGGDGDDVWTYTSPSERDMFDVSKLAQWEIVFSHMDSLGIMLHLVTQEKENQKLLDNGALGNFRKIYYRELIARFSHHLAITWNLGEENGPQGNTNAQSDQQRRDMAMYFKTHDPYGSFVTVHNLTGDETELFGPLLGNQYFDGMSVQSDKGAVNNKTIEWRNNSDDAGRKWIICHDETTGGVPTDESPRNHDQLRATALWGSYMGGGGGVEWYFGFPGDLNAETFRNRSGIWRYTKIANDFFNNYIPFWEMTPNNSLTSTSNDFCLAKAGEIYVIYLINASTTNINLATGNYTIKWYNPKTGGNLLNGSKTTATGGNNISIGNPPSANEDWVVLIKSTSSIPPLQCAQLEVISFTLVSTSGGDIAPFTTGTVIDLSETENFSIRANVCDEPVGSVRFTLNGSIIRTENGVPYSINGDFTNGYNAWNPPPGYYSLTATPYAGSNGGGTAGISETVTFSVVQQSGCNTDSQCNDNNACTVDNCNSGQCVNAPLDCDDSNLCTIDACSNGACTYQTDPNCNTPCSQPEVTSFTLVHAETGDDIGALNNEAVINLSTIGSFSIRANACDDIGSVGFKLNGSIVRFENYPPYSIEGDYADGSYEPWTPNPGNYTLVGIPYSSTNGNGTQGISETVSFSVVQQQSGCTQLEVVSFTLVNASSGAAIAPLTNGKVIDKSSIGSFSIRANVCDDPVGSVGFKVNGTIVQYENSAPYLINGSSPWNPDPGNYTLVGIPYSSTNGSGSQGVSETVSFSVVNGSNKMHAIELTQDPNTDLISPFKIYPNPFTNRLQIDFTAPKPGQAEIRIFNSLGQLMSYESINFEEGENQRIIYFDKNLAVGIYFIEIHSGTHRQTGRVYKTL